MQIEMRPKWVDGASPQIKPTLSIKYIILIDLRWSSFIFMIFLMWQVECLFMIM